MELKANLVVKLYANDVLVAESDDPVLWNSVMQGAKKTEKPKLITHVKTDNENGENSSAPTHLPPSPDSGNGDAVVRWANAVAIESDEIIGACYPSHEEPFLHIDQHYWAAFKANTPKRGNNALTSVIIVSTLLVEWFKYAKLGDCTYTQVKKILHELGAEPQNPSRSFNKCPWLAKHGDVIKLNPANVLQADAVVKAFCTKQPIQ